MSLRKGKTLTQKSKAAKRNRVAREAAELLYTGQEKEYMHAKRRAAAALGVNILPSNAEVAEGIEQIAEEREGRARQLRLVKLRRVALDLMQAIQEFKPILVGSVWRGTAHRHSDLDIMAYAQFPEEVVDKLNDTGYNIKTTNVQSITKNGEKDYSLHVYVELTLNSEAEIVIRPPLDVNRQVRCEIFGDVVKGLTIQHLKEVLEKNPTQRFTPP